MTYADLLAGVRSYLNRPTITDEEIGLWIGNLESELNIRLREHPRNLRRAQKVQPAGAETLALPSDIAQLVEVRAGDATLVQVVPEARYRVPASRRGFIQWGDCLELLPPFASDTAVTVHYCAFLVPFTAESENWLSQYFGSLYLAGCLREAAKWVKDDARLASWSPLFEQQLDGIISQGWGQNLAAGAQIR